MSVTAWADVAVLKKAQWDSTNGYTVQFALSEPTTEDKSNPFKRFTKMRKNRVGTRFGAVIVVAKYESIRTYNDEVMLKGWTDSNAGQTVSFWLANVGGNGHPFAGFSEGEEFAIALVELDDDNTAVDQDKRERAEAALPKNGEAVKPKERHKQSLAQAAAMMCNNPVFWKWIDRVHPVWGATDATEAASFMRGYLAIESRRVLDTDMVKAELFHANIRKPFVDWQRANRVGEFA